MTVDDKILRDLNVAEGVLDDTEKLPSLVDIEETYQLVDYDATQLEQFETDYQYAREHLRSIIDTARDALKTLVLVSKDTEHPRAFEATGKLMETIAKSTRDLMDLHKNKVEILSKLNSNNSDSDSSATQQASTINNTQYVFNGTTAELLDQIEENEKAKNNASS
jgi:hypothetical protein